MREAVFSVNDTDLSELGIEELVETVQASGLRDFEEFACYGNGAVVQVEVDERIDEERVDDLEYVDRIERLAAEESFYRYLIAFEAPAMSEAAADHAEDLLGTCDPDVTGKSNTMSLVGPQGAIRGTVEAFEEAGVSPELRQLGTFEGETPALDDLTDRQQEVLRTAYEMGYFAVPREVSTEDIAAELELDSSTVAEHLQRAEKNLLSKHFPSADD